MTIQWEKIVVEYHISRVFHVSTCLTSGQVLHGCFTKLAERYIMNIVNVQNKVFPQFLSDFPG